MYIRRKAFSTVIDENGEEKYFSTNEIINEEDYLAEINYSDKDKLTKDEKTGLGIAAGGAALTAAGTGYGIRHGRKTIESIKKSLRDAGKRTTEESVKSVPSWMLLSEVAKNKNLKEGREIVAKIAKKHPEIREISPQVENQLAMRKGLKRIRRGKVAALAGIGATIAGTSMYKNAKNKKKNKE